MNKEKLIQQVGKKFLDWAYEAERNSSRIPHIGYRDITHGDAWAFVGITGLCLSSVPAMIADGNMRQVVDLVNNNPFVLTNDLVNRTNMVFTITASVMAFGLGNVLPWTAMLAFSSRVNEEVRVSTVAGPLLARGLRAVGEKLCD